MFTVSCYVQNCLDMSMNQLGSSWYVSNVSRIFQYLYIYEYALYAQGILKAHPAWGLSKEVLDSRQKLSVVIDRVRKRVMDGELRPPSAGEFASQQQATHCSGDEGEKNV